MQISDFKPTPYKYKTMGGEAVMGEYTDNNGLKYYLLEDEDKVNRVVRASGLSVICLDVKTNDEPVKIINFVKEDHSREIAELDKRIAKLENLLNITKEGDTII
jgi:glycerophosphoryl diester phosphodiesterase